jgi:hypothetical protein
MLEQHRHNGRGKHIPPLWIWIGATLMVACTVAIQSTSPALGELAVKQWSVVELDFSAGQSHPWDDFPLQVTFVHSGGTTLTLDAYWDGGSSWQVRFAPPLSGTWNWTSSSSDPAMDGLNGTLQVTTPTASDTGNNPNYRGHLTVGPNNRHLVYRDGTPFFWLGDTNWTLNSLQCGLAEGSQGRPFYEYVQDRKAKKFTVIQTQLFTQMFGSLRPNEGGHAFLDNTTDNGNFEDLNPPHFQALDTRFQEIWDQGLVLAPHPSWLGKIEITPLAAKRLSRYYLARYGAYNIVWSLSGEYQYGYDDKGLLWSTSDWQSLGNFIRDHNPFEQVITVHPSGRTDWENMVPGAGQQSSSGQFHDEPWLAMNWIQTGHSQDRLENIPLRVAIDYGQSPVKPVAHVEGWYEGHDLNQDPPTGAQIRWQAWASLLNGAAGHTYGATGVWSFYNPDVDTSPPLSWDATTWYEGLAAPGSSDLQHVRGFFSGLEWWSLVPNRDWVTIDGATPQYDYRNNRQDPHLASSPDRNYFVVYIPDGNQNKTIAITNLASQNYRGQWFNPRSGAWSTTNIANPIAPDVGGNWTIPARPSPAADDWVLLLSPDTPPVSPTPTPTPAATPTATPTPNPAADKAVYIPLIMAE